MMHLTQVAHATSGELAGVDVLIDRVVTDTRSDCGGGLFVALSGDNFDAHDFIDQAETAGAAAVLIEREVQTSLPSIQVDNTLTALGRLAAWWRQQFDIPLMAITGSVGKTTVKEMLATIFARQGEGIATKGNLNNEIGVPLTLLRLHEKHKYAVVEMGMNHAGEIHRLSTMALPTIALVNNAGEAHLEGLGSVAAVAQAKGEIFDGLQDRGIAVINADDDYSDLWQEKTNGFKQILFGLSSDADVSATFKAGEDGQLVEISGLQAPCCFQLNALGEHSVRNALAAAAVAHAANVAVDDIAAGLEAFTAVEGRLNLESVGAVILIDDTYNANPASMRAAIDVLADYPNSLLILGDMAELGVTAKEEHRALGAYADLKDIKHLYACGSYAQHVVDEFSGSGFAYADQEALIDDLAGRIDSQITDNQNNSLAVLVKGSRSAKMEKVVAAARQHLASISNDNLGAA